MRAPLPFLIVLALIPLPLAHMQPDTPAWGYALLLACGVCTASIMLRTLIPDLPPTDGESRSSASTALQAIFLVVRWACALAAWCVATDPEWMATAAETLMPLPFWMIACTLLHVGETLVDPVLHSYAKRDLQLWAPQPPDLRNTWEHLFEPYTYGFFLPACATLALQACHGTPILLLAFFLSGFAALPFILTATTLLVYAAERRFA